MKTKILLVTARVGAVLSFGCLFVPGAWLLGFANGREEPIAIVLGLCLIGNAFFGGTLLWLWGERVSGAVRE